MTKEQTLISKIDSSVNFVLENGLECRFVQRSPEYFIIYVSSQTGCNQSCRFCHLTQTGQTEDINASKEDIIRQVNKVLAYWFKHHHNGKSSLEKVHVNFMARGEPLLNPVITKHYKQLFDIICDNVYEFTGIGDVRFNISTIIPKDVNKEDLLNFNDERARIYYSLYSTNEQFRKRWLPKAMDVKTALSLLKNQDYLTIHHALIKGENDSLEDAYRVVSACSFLDSEMKLNIVQYNPFSSVQGQESDSETIDKYVKYMEHQDFFTRIKIIERVGLDVKASCGMFVEHPVDITRLSKET